MIASGSITMPALYPAQQEIASDETRFRVAVLGRRAGKSLMASVVALVAGLQGQACVWVAPTYGQAGVGFAAVKRLVAHIPGASVRESDRRITLPKGGTIEFRSADQPDNLRGHSWDLAIIDEAAYVPDTLFDSVIRPALADRRGRMLAISTPLKIGDHFHQWFLRGRGGDPEWKSWQLPSSANPYLPPGEIDAARASMSAIAFQREFLAEFVSTAGAIIKHEWLRFETPPSDLSAITMGIDLAVSEKTTADWSACVVLGRASDGKVYVLAADRTRASFHELQAWIATLAARWRPQAIVIEQAMHGAAVVTELQRTTSLPIRGVTPKGDKVTRAAPLTGRIQSGIVRFAKDIAPWFVDELTAFPVATHDDGVDALSHAFAACDSPRAFAEFDPARHVIRADEIRYGHTLGVTTVGVHQGALVAVARSRDGTTIVTAEAVTEDTSYVNEGLQLARELHAAQRPERFVCDPSDEVATHALREEFWNSTAVVWAHSRSPDVPTLIRNARVALLGKSKSKAPSLRISEHCPQLIQALTAFGSEPAPVAVALARALEAL
jgi:predicted phage terminase large subunit-like protein